MRIIVASDDICLVKQIINIIDKINTSIVLDICKSSEFKEIIEKEMQPKGEVWYLVDADSMQDDFWDLMDKLRSYDFESKIVVISINDIFEKLARSNLLIFDYIRKGYNLESRLKYILEFILKRKEKEERIKISDREVPVVLDRNQIDDMYRLPNNQVSIYYKGGNNNLIISLDKASKDIKEIAKNKYYISKKEFNSDKSNRMKRKNYDDHFKQLLVDLHVVFKMDFKTLADPLPIEVKDIKRWASLVKYNKKISFLRALVARIMFRMYFKK